MWATSPEVGTHSGVKQVWLRQGWVPLLEQGYSPTSLLVSISGSPAAVRVGHEIHHLYPRRLADGVHEDLDAGPVGTALWSWPSPLNSMSLHSLLCHAIKTATSMLMRMPQTALTHCRCVV